MLWLFFKFVVLCQFVYCIDEDNQFNEEPTIYKYKTLWFNQRVDHFNFVTEASFSQRYLVNDSYWNGNGGPIFFYTGNEGNIEAFAENSGFMWESMKQFEAMLVFAEHRYYGESIPFMTANHSSITKLNGFLTSEQALADFAALIVHIRSTLDGAKNSPVIAFGGSYGGMLAAWLRIKYPHLCLGAIAASAPIVQFTTDCKAFGQLTTSVYSAESSKCSDTIKRSWLALDNIASTSDGIRWLNDQVKFCSPLSSKSDIEELKSYLQDLWINLAMMNYPYPTSFLMPLPGNPVKRVCKIIVQSLDEKAPFDNMNIVQSILHGASIYFNFTQNTKCLNLIDEDQIGAEMWDYQSCTEMVMPFCYNGKNDMFEAEAWNMTAFAEKCRKRWNVTPRPNMAFLMYGGKELEAASNIIFSNGLLDPWASGGILKNISPSVVALLIEGGAHHLDLRARNKNDPFSVIDARKTELAFIRKWIKHASY